MLLCHKQCLAEYRHQLAQSTITRQQVCLTLLCYQATPQSKLNTVSWWDLSPVMFVKWWKQCPVLSKETEADSWMFWTLVYVYNLTLIQNSEGFLTWICFTVEVSSKWEQCCNTSGLRWREEQSNSTIKERTFILFCPLHLCQWG